MTAHRKFVAANDPTKPTPDELEALASGKLPLINADRAKATRFMTSPPPERQWLFKNVLPLGITGILVAPGGTGKSTFAIQMGVAVATGTRLADVWEVGEAGAALLLMAEDDDSELHRRVCNVADQQGLTGGALDNLYVASLVGRDVRLISQSREHGIEHTDVVARLIATAKQIENLKLIVIDPASRYRDGDENSAGDTTKFVQAIERIGQETGATVLLIHHTSKGAIMSGESSQGAARGSSALTDGVRWQAQLATVTKNTNKVWKLPENDMRNHVVLSVTKANYSAPQADLLLKRMNGGYLSKTDQPTQPKDLGHADTAIIALIKSEATEGRHHAQRAFTDAFGGSDKALGLSDHALRLRIKILLEAGKLRLERKKLVA